MRRSMLPVLSLALLAACASPNPGRVLGQSRVSVAPIERDGVAHSSAWLADMDGGSVDAGPGQLEIINARGETEQLELAALSVDVEIVGSMAGYAVEHVFVNPGDAVVEGTFRFPLPSGAIVTGLAMEIDGKLMEGAILERDRARAIYEEIVDSMRDPALLEWEAGQTFKLRVFPIQPGERKRVIMRYMAPLIASDEAASGLALLVPSAAPAMQSTIASLQVRVDGKPVLERSDSLAHEDLLVPVEAGQAPSFVTERYGDHRYFAARLELDWASVPAPIFVPSERRRRVIVVDSSRSALETWPLANETVATLLAGLGADDEIMILACDLETRAITPGFVRNTVEGRQALLDQLAAITPDGASDLGVALDQIGEALATPSEGALDQVIYIGDGTPTWGTTDRAALAERARVGLHGAPLYALSLGKRESRDLLEALSGASGGRTSRPQTLAQVDAFVAFLERAPEVRRIAQVEVEVPGIEGVRAPISATWFEGERPVIHFRAERDQALPTRVIVRGRAGDEAFEQTLALGKPAKLEGVHQQWAARELLATPDKLASVALSVEHGVLGKHTALLVLESEEAYERYAIDRSRRADPNDPSSAGRDPAISGRDLDGDASQPYLGPGDLQPGDPEIHIPAPRDALSVEVVFPFGETKPARWEEELGQWTLRFLVDDEVEPGVYEVLVRITHADGRVEILHLDYTIDVEAPQIELELRLRDDGAYDVLAHQVLAEADAARERPEGRVGDERARTLDARHVDLIMPDGQTLALRRGERGHFVRRWAPKTAVQWPARVSVVVGDRALNSRRIELPLDLPESAR